MYILITSNNYNELIKFLITKDKNHYYIEF